MQDGWFDWGGVGKPRIPMDHTVVYEAHVKGLTQLNPAVPAELRGTYAGLAHESTIAYLKDLGVTTIELLPVHQSVSEQRLQKMGLVNYWGYNTLNFFTPHAAYASRAAQFGGTGAVLREFKGMVRLLHEAGLEVVLDVVYNHTAEEGRGGPTSSLRGLDDAHYYRHLPDGSYLDTTGCGNTVDYSTPAAQRLVLDSLRYWANEVQVDGFRFDLAATLGRDADARLHPRSPPAHGHRHRSSARGGQADRRAVGCRSGRLAGRQLRVALVGVERRLPRPHAQLLAARHRRGARSGRHPE